MWAGTVLSASHILTHLILKQLYQLCTTLCDPMDCNLPGSSVHGILQARILEWVPCPPPGDLPDPGIEPVSLMSPGLAGGFFTINVSYYLKLARYMPQINLPIYKSSNMLYVCRWKITALRILVSSSQCPCIFLVKQSVKSLNQKKMSNPLNSYKKRGREIY